MFKVIDLKLNAGPIKNAWERLNRQIQTDVEHTRVTNSTVSGMSRGSLVALTAGNRQAIFAQANAEVTARWAAVMAEDVPAGGRGIARTDGYALVRFETGQAAFMQEGNFAYVSISVPGVATPIAPLSGYSKRVGIIADVSEYSDANPFAYVILGHCCAPVAIVA